MSQTITSKTEAMLLRKVAAVSQTAVASAIGHDAGTVSRIFSNKTGLHIADMEAFFNALGLKLIECDDETITLPKAHYEALRTLAQIGVQHGKA